MRPNCLSIWNLKILSEFVLALKNNDADLVLCVVLIYSIMSTDQMLVLGARPPGFDSWNRTRVGARPYEINLHALLYV
jgi:hypothetical protein